jgi:hypothetical protein
MVARLYPLTPGRFASAVRAERIRNLAHRFIHLMPLDVPSALFRRRPGSTFAVGTGFRRCSEFDMSDGASLSDESCE